MTEGNDTSLRTVLVIDDTAENLALLNAVLAGHYKVKIANNGPRGLAIAQGDEPPDVILLDVVMPGMDGLETCRLLKTNASTAAIPVIFLSGKTDALEEEQGLEAGAADYLHKPINPAMVVRRVETQLRLAAAEKTLARLAQEAAVRQRDTDEQTRAIEAFESVVTHDARSSLSVINGYASLLRKKSETAGEAQATQFLTSIRDGAKKVSTLTTQWRETSRTLRRPMRPEDLDMQALVKAALHEALEGRDAESEPLITLDPLPHAWADAEAIKRVWTQMILNAVTYAKPGQRAMLHIHARRGPTEHVFCMDDQGLGFASGDDQLLFAPFQRLHEDIAPASAGLGLFIARQAVVRNGGQMWAEGEPGAGARFRFSLPCAPVDLNATGGRTG